MTTLKVGIASYKEMKARTMAVARGERRPMSPGFGSPRPSRSYWKVGLAPSN
jgi:predicted transcriptional regulator